jgi:hypothetical protein
VPLAAEVEMESISDDMVNNRKAPFAKRSPLWLRSLAAALVAASCLLLFATPPSTEIFGNSTDHGWPRVSVRVTRTMPMAGEGEPVVSSVEIRWTALFYDVVHIASLVGMSIVFFLPWREFPRPRFSLADLFALMTCLTIGTLLWYQMCVVGASVSPLSQRLLAVNTAAYLLISLAYAGVLNGLIARLSW